MKQTLPNKKKSFLQKAALKAFPIMRQERTQSFIIVVLTFLALSIFGLFAINPTITTIIQLHKQLADNTFVYNKLQEKITNLSTLQTKYNNLQPDLPLVLAAIPDTHNIAQVIAQTQQIAIKNNVNLLAIQSDPVTIAPNPAKNSSISFSFTIQGTKQNILHFITSFMSFERITTINEIVLSTTTNTKNQVTTQATIQAQIFFKPF